jgi:hypothetical protein
METPKLGDEAPPTETQIQTALEAAQQMREMGIDPHHLGHVALYLHERNQALERFVRDADRYFRFGQDDGDRRALIRQIEKLAARSIRRPEFPV